MPHLGWGEERHRLVALNTASIIAQMIAVSHAADRGTLARDLVNDADADDDDDVHMRTVIRLCRKSALTSRCARASHVRRVCVCASVCIESTAHMSSTAYGGPGVRASTRSRKVCSAHFWVGNFPVSTLNVCVYNICRSINAMCAFSHSPWWKNQQQIAYVMYMCMNRSCVYIVAYVFDFCFECGAQFIILGMCASCRHGYVAHMFGSKSIPDNAHVCDRLGQLSAECKPMMIRAYLRKFSGGWYFV